MAVKDGLVNVGGRRIHNVLVISVYNCLLQLPAQVEPSAPVHPKERAFVFL